MLQLLFLFMICIAPFLSLKRCHLHCVCDFSQHVISFIILGSGQPKVIHKAKECNNTGQDPVQVNVYTFLHYYFFINQ